MLRSARHCACALVLTCLAAPAAARAQDSLLVRALSRAAMPLTIEGGRLGGPGAAMLAGEARQSQFVLVGEDHGMRELPQLTAALFRAVQPLGYRHLAVEVGPFSTRMLERTLRAPGGLAAYGRGVRADPWAVPFQMWKEETEMAADVLAAAGGREGTLWGVDQEFIAATPMHLRRLAALAPNAAARRMALAYADSAAAADRRVVTEKNPTLFYLTSAPAGTYARLASAFHAAPGSEAAGLLEELAESAAIYAGQFDGHGFESNARRSLLMKRRFMEAYRRAQAAGEPQPRVLVKLGAYHSIRGRSFTGVFDIGNLLSELAASNGTRSFHLFVLTWRGTRNAFLPFVGDEKEKQHALNPAEDLDFMDARPLLAAADSGAYTLIDLRSARAAIQRNALGTIDPGLRTLIWGYDAVLVVPEAHASTFWFDAPLP
jgi:hypothetical protein